MSRIRNRKFMLLVVTSLCLVAARDELCLSGISSPEPHPDGTRSCCSKLCGDISCSSDDPRDRGCSRKPGGNNQCCQRDIFISKLFCKRKDETGCLLPPADLKVVAPLPEKISTTASSPSVVSKKEFDNVPGEIPVYWINMDTSPERAAFIQEQFKAANFRSSHRVSAVTTKDVLRQIQIHLMETTANKTMWWPPSDNLTPYFAVPSDVARARESLYESDPRLVSCGESCLSLGELACLMSHVTAIKMAYAAGLEAAIIMEDDARVVGDFHGSELRGYLESAGPNSIIQLYMTGPKGRVLEALTHERGTVFPGYGHSTIGYVITRDCMAAILKNVGNGGRTMGYFLWALRWVDPPRVSRWPADYSLYDSCTSYSSARPFMRHQTSFGSTIHIGHEEYHQQTEDLLDKALAELPENKKSRSLWNFFSGKKAPSPRTRASN